jgi:hypothetical protein
MASLASISESGRGAVQQSLAADSGGTGTYATPTDGQVLIGNGTNYTANTLTPGTGVDISNAAGAVTISLASPKPDQPSSITVGRESVYLHQHAQIQRRRND